MFWQFVINGFITGVLYSLLAIGFALIYNTTRIFHIAAAGIYVFAAYMFYLFAVQLTMPLLLAAFLAVALTMALSLATEVLVYRPLKRRKASLNAAMIASIGVMMMIVNLELQEDGHYRLTTGMQYSEEPLRYSRPIKL